MSGLHPFFYIGIALWAALAARKITEMFKLPAVTGYVIVGVLLGVSFLHLVEPDTTERMNIISDIALALIAFTIGSELNLRALRKMGRSILTIALGESLGAFVLVFAATAVLSDGDIALALVLGSVASATAPAATLMVLQQYRAKGPLTTTILAVVGFDDALALVIYAFAASAARAILKHQTHFSLARALGMPILEIACALFIGAAFAFLSGFVLRRLKNVEEIFIATCALIALVSGCAKLLHASQLLANMTCGLVVANANPKLKHRIMRDLFVLGPLIYALFFVLAGARLDARLLPRIGVLGLGYLVARVVGKTAGAYLGARAGKAGPTVRKYVGFSLIPQVGVAVALAIIVGREFGHGRFGEQGNLMAAYVINILLFTTIITEIAGPYLTRWAIVKSGEATQPPLSASPALKEEG